ncbi:MAG: hypothetical protein Q8L68_04050 [Methylococcales bacterium]|nr:hypothetical protein [Methylococcales bacterium]
MKTKKIPYYLLLSLLTIGASLIIGFLSFGGMFALWPILGLAIGAFVLSVAYEGEIYLQNIKGALNKLFKRNYLEHHLAKEYLLANFPDTNENDCPQFFKDYQIKLNHLHKFGHHALDKASRTQRRAVQKTLTDLEKLFAEQLYSTAKEGSEKSASLTNYEKELRTWLSAHKQSAQIELLKKRTNVFKGVAAFSIVSGLFMGLGTTYLLVGEFAAIPLLAAISPTLLPVIIVPMAIIAGAAYALLTYNALTDMINNDTLRKWYRKFRDDFKEGITFRKIFIATTAVFLLGLAVALTICTAGTWWTIAKNARPLFGWMGKIPGFVMGVINPLVTGASALIFNVQNTSETLEIIDDMLKIKGNVFQRTIEKISKAWTELKKHENWLQILNPVRIALKLILVPFQAILFLSHLGSIAATADRFPGIPEIISFCLGFGSEFFEDAHYYAGHHHHHGHKFEDLLKERLEPGHSHNHSMDIPTFFLKYLALLIPFTAAATWDWLASKLNKGSTREVLSFKNAWLKQTGQERKISRNPTAEKELSNEWKTQHTIHLIERHIQKHLTNVIINADVAANKVKKLRALQDALRRDKGAVSIKDRLEEAQKDPYYNKHRLFGTGDTRTQTFLNNLPVRINVSPAA